MWKVATIPTKNGGVYVPFPVPLIKEMNFKLGDLFDFEIGKNKELILSKNKSGKIGKKTLKLIEFKGEEKTSD